MLDNLIKKLYHGGKLWRTIYILCYAIFWGSKARLWNSVCVLPQKGFGVSPRKFFKIYMQKVHFPAFWMNLFYPKILLKLMRSCIMIYFWEPNAQLCEFCVVMRAKRLPIAQSSNSVSCLKRGLGCHPGKFFKSMSKILHFRAFWVSSMWSVHKTFLSFSWRRQKMKEHQNCQNYLE